MFRRDVEVVVARDGERRTLRMVRAPRVGGVLVVEGGRWVVVSVSYTVPYRVPLLLVR